jgi:HSP20 family protein
MRRMMEDMDRMFEGLSERQGAGLAQLWAPPIEILERNGRFVVRADLPGLAADDVRIEVRDHGLILEGERKSEIEVEEEGGVYRSERTYGRFSREIPMPDGVDVDKAQARFENGVLEIEIPLREDARRRRIEIKGGSPRPAPGDKAVH